MPDAALHHWRLLIDAGGRITRSDLEAPARVLISAQGVMVDAEPGRGATFIARADGVLELARDADTPVLLNDVQLARGAELRAGDLVQVGSATVLVQRASPPPSRPAAPFAWPRAHFEARLREELQRAALLGSPLSLVLLRGDVPDSREDVTAIHCRLSPVLTAIMLLDTGAAESDRWLRDGAGEQRIAGRATAADDAVGYDELVECALARFHGDVSPQPRGSSDERVVVDPVTMRLRALAERSAVEGRGVLLEGEPGVGKRLWAWHLHLRSGRRAESWTDLDARRLTPEQFDAALRRDSAAPRAGSLLIRHIEALSEEFQERLLAQWPSHLRVIATTTTFAEEQRRRIHPELLERIAHSTLAIPALRDRPQEILPLAMQALQQARTRLRRPGLAMNADFRAALQAWEWPGNVRELRNEIALASQLAESDELRLENLSPRIAPETGARDLRQSMKMAEKSALLSVLARTNWNVTAAAKELGLPRRTVVYRISRLGLRRPAR